MPSREERRWQHFEAADKTRAVRKQIKRNRKPKRVRRKDWIPDDLDNLDALDAFAESERVMPLGERERRQSVMAAASAKLDLTKPAESETPSPDEIGEQQGVVTEVSSSLCRVDLDRRSVICGLRGSLTAQESGFTNIVAVGDRVIVSENGSDRGVVEAVLPRRSVLARQDSFYSHLRQVIVANADQLLIVASWKDPLIWFELVDRYLIAGERNGLSPVICVNKIDLAEDLEGCRTALRPYTELAYKVLFTSAQTGQGVDELRDVLMRHTTVLAGLSGVGKSSLLTSIQPDLRLRTGQISDTHREGRHVTTQVSLLRLDTGGFVADTPGIREFGLGDLRRRELPRFYREFASLEGRCRFADCSHVHEPACAVKDGVELGLVSATRYHSYKKIHEDLAD